MISYKKNGLNIVMIMIAIEIFSTIANCQKISTDSLLSRAFANDQLLLTLINSAQKSHPK